MPFVKRSVEPKHLSRKPLLDKSLSRDELEAVANGTLVEALRQLACLALFADEIFGELAADVAVIGARTERLKDGIARVHARVQGLDAKKVAVPVGTLADFSRVRPHYAAPQPVDKDLFTPASRPAFVHRLYDTAVVSPVCVMRQIDRYRQDGRRSSKCFLCLPFFKDVKVNFDVEIEMRRPASLSAAPRDWLSDDDTLDSIVISAQMSRDREDSPEGEDGSSGSLSLEECEDALRQLPTPEEKTYVMSLKYPYSDVPIDVTGKGFKRMTTLRRSFIQQMENMAKRRKRGKRRNTIVGSSVDNKDLEAALQRASKKNAANLATSGTQTCDGGDFEAGTSSRQNHVCFEDASKTSSKSKLNSLNRSKKGLLSKNNNNNSDSDNKASSEKPDGGSSSPRDGDEKAAEGGSSGFRWFQRRSRNRNSIIGGIGIYEELDRVKKSRRSLLASLLPSVVAEDKSASSSPSKSSTDSAVVTCSTSSSSSRRTSAKNAKNRSSLPISTLTQAMSMAVKMRENSARGKEDGGQSSSGNWSASSSTRTSMESEEPVRTAASPDMLNRTGSQTSLSKDSALSDRMTPNDERWPDSANGYQSDSTHSSCRKPGFRLTRRAAKTDTARWLRSLEEEGALGRSAGETTDAASSTGTLTPRVHRRALSPLAFGDDGESSEFSVDNDGYFTSMHTDSGLRAVPACKFGGGGSTFGKASRLSDLREQDQGSQSSVGSLGSSKASSKKATSSEETSNKDSTDAPDPESPCKAKKVPPPPPPRTSTLSRPGPAPKAPKAPEVLWLTDSAPKAPEEVLPEPEPDTPTSDSATSSAFRSDDSEAENGAGERLKLKTTITTGRIPSLCVVTPSQSDDEEERTASGASRGAVEPWASAPSALPLRPANHTLPRSFGRSASLDAGAATNTWPRRLLYSPELVSVQERVCRADSLPSGKGPSMSTFSRPWGGRRPNSIACAPTSPPGPPSTPCGPVASSQQPAGRQGARVTLDSTGQVIHSTGSLPRRSGTSAAEAPLAAASPAPAESRKGAYVRVDAGGSGPERDVPAPPPRAAPAMPQNQHADPPRNQGQSPRPALQASNQSHGPLPQRPNHGPDRSQPQKQPRQYDSNTLPRWRPSMHDRPVPVFPSEALPEAPAAGYPSGSLPRRWNNFGFLRRDQQPLLPSAPSPPEPLSTSRTGAYVRLDGHPAHLEPGTPSRIRSEQLGPSGQQAARSPTQTPQNLLVQRPALAIGSSGAHSPTSGSLRHGSPPQNLLVDPRRPSPVQHPASAQTPHNLLVQHPASSQAPHNLVQHPASAQTPHNLVQHPASAQTPHNLVQHPASAQTPHNLLVQHPASSQTPHNLLVQHSASSQAPHNLVQHPASAQTPHNLLVQHPASSQTTHNLLVQHPASSQTPHNLLQHPASAQTPHNLLVQHPASAQTPHNLFVQHPASAIGSGAQSPTSSGFRHSSPPYSASSGGQYGIAAPPAAMPLMQQLSYRPSRIPMVPGGGNVPEAPGGGRVPTGNILGGSRSSPPSGPGWGQGPNSLPPYYRPVGAGPPEGNLSRSPVPHNGYPSRPQSEGTRIPAPQPSPPFVRSMSTPPGDPRRRGWNGLTHLTLGGQSPTGAMNCLGLPAPGHPGEFGNRSGGTPGSPHTRNGQQPQHHARTGAAATHHSPQVQLLAYNGMQRARTPAGDLDTSVRPSTTPARTPRTPPCTQGPPSPARGSHRAGHPQSAHQQLLGSGSSPSARSTMSTDDLFAAIHHSKKKMKVKTDLDRSLSPASSRSSSPAFSVSSLKCRKPETGTLPAAGDRRSWAGDQSSPTSSPAAAATSNSPGDRRSWASDRLGPTRPTSMHDFKLLLLQAGRTSPKEAAPVKRPSASEMLRSASPARNASGPSRAGSTNSGATTSSGTTAGPPAAVASPVRPYGPIRNRLQGRCRASASSVLHNRTDVLSTPIMEDDCSEEDSDGPQMSGHAIRC